MRSVLGISGSLREGSSNTALLETARGLLPSGVTLELAPSLGLLPHFNPDLDREGMQAPPAVAELRARIDRAEALLISTPEYAHGIPGVLKNALDWLVSHPGFVGKRVGVVLASASDGAYARDALLEVLRTMSVRVDPAWVLTMAGSRVRLDEGALKKTLESLIGD
jgi:NAD(P)H-dependent FMN reductase